MGEVAMGLDPFRIFSDATSFEMSRGIFCLYGANVLWNLLYETIYSHQDAKYDKEIGVKNIVLLYEGRMKPFLSKLAVGQVIFLFMARIYSNASLVYFAGVFGVSLSLEVIISEVKLEDPESCSWWFKTGCVWFTGGTLFTGLSTEYSWS